MLPANKESVLTLITKFCGCTCPGRWGEECVEQNLRGQGLDPFCQTQYSHQWVDALCYLDSNRKDGVLCSQLEALFFSIRMVSSSLGPLFFSHLSFICCLQVYLRMFCIMINGNPLQHSCLENPMDRGALQATVLGVAKSWVRLSS